MFYAYVLKSIEHDFYYKGHCEDVQKRLKQHNSGKTRSIKHYIPFTIVYVEAAPTREEAIKREKYFKSAAGRKFLRSKFQEKEFPKLQMQVPCPTNVVQAGIPVEATTTTVKSLL